LITNCWPKPPAPSNPADFRRSLYVSPHLEETLVGKKQALMSPKHFESVPVPAVASLSGSRRAIIEFTGLDMAGSSYEGRVFLNNPGAGPDTPTTPEQGYAGSFTMYAYGNMPPSETPAAAPGVARIPMRRSLVATEAVRRAAARGATARVTLVPVPPGATPTEGNVPQETAEPPVTAESVAIRAEDDGSGPQNS
jgi:hypothetical protein